MIYLVLAFWTLVWLVHGAIGVRMLAYRNGRIVALRHKNRLLGARK